MPVKQENFSKTAGFSPTLLRKKNSHTDIIHIYTTLRSSCRKVIFKKVFLKVLQNLQESTLFKRLQHRFSCEFCEILQKTFGDCFSTLTFQNGPFGGCFGKKYQSALYVEAIISLYPQNNVLFNQFFKPDFKNVMRNIYSKTLKNTCKRVQFEIGWRPTRLFLQKQLHLSFGHNCQGQKFDFSLKVSKTLLSVIFKVNMISA